MSRPTSPGQIVFVFKSAGLARLKSHNSFPRVMLYFARNMGFCINTLNNSLVITGSISGRLRRDLASFRQGRSLRGGRTANCFQNRNGQKFKSGEMLNRISPACKVPKCTKLFIEIGCSGTYNTE